MSFELTSERLQQIAVACVSKFITKEASLNEAIAKEAMDLELNSDQTKRVIEASNTIAYLRQLEKSADRTFEFDVGDYSKVMAIMCMPDDMLKSAGTPPWLDKDKDGKEDGKEDDKGESKDKKDKDDADEKKHKGEDFGKGKEDKKDSKSSDDKDSDKSKAKDKDKAVDDKSDDKDEESDEDDSEEKQQEKKAMLRKGYFTAVNTLEKMAYDEAGLGMELVRVAGVVGKDPHALEKLAFVVDAEDLAKTAKLCGVEKRAQENLVFVERDLKDARALYDLYKEAQALLTKKAELEDFVARAGTLLFKSPVDVEKQAGLITKGIGAVAGGIARGVGAVVGKTTAGAGAAITSGVKNVGAFGRASRQAGYKSTSEGVAAYDKIRKTQGTAAAQAKFGGKKPSTLVHRVGIGGVLTATTGLSMDHKNNVKDL